MTISNRDRILPPYTRRVNGLRHRLLKASAVSATLALAIIMGFWIAIFATLVVPMFVGIIGLVFLIAMWMALDEEPDLSRPAASLMVAYLALSVAWPSYLAVEIPGLPWLTPTRMALAMLSVLMLLQVSQSRIVRGHITGAIAGMKLPFIGYAMLIVMMFATVVLASKPGEAMSFSVQQIILWTIPLLAGLWLFQEPDVVIRATRAMGIALMIVMLLTIGEYHNKLPIWIPYIPSFLKVDAPQMGSFLSSLVRLDGSYRAKGNFGIHLYYSQLLLMFLPFAIHWLLDAKTPTRRFWAFAYIILALTAIWMNNTRTATTGQLVVIAGMLGLFALRHHLRTQNKLDLMAPAFALGIPLAAAVLAILIAISPRLQTMTIGGTQNAGSDAVREGQWNRAWSAVGSNPFGYGSGESGPLTGRVTDGGIWIVDSQWINFMVDYGLLGALGWALLLGITAGVGALIYLQRVDDSADLAGPTAVGIGSFMMSMYTISFVGNIPLLMTFLAIVCATRHRLVREGKLLPMSQVFERAMNRKQPIEAAGARS
jgi:hypothetical protein